MKILKTMAYSKLGPVLKTREQAKSLSELFSKFDEVHINFTRVKEVSLSFAHEIFSEFKSKNPNTSLIPTNMSDEIKGVIENVMSCCGENKTQQCKESGLTKDFME